MSDPTLEPRVTLLESLMGELVSASIRTQQSVEQLSREMGDFKDEMKDFKNEMKDFKDRMLKFEEDNARDRRAFNKQLGEIANKQGRMVEDIVEPSMDRIFKELLALPPDAVTTGGMRVKRPHPRTGRVREFDVIRAYGDYVLANETKSTLRPEDVDHVLMTINEIREYFPEYKERRLMASVAVLKVDESLVTYASRKGVIVLAVGDHLMDIQNESGFRPTEF